MKSTGLEDTGDNIRANKVKLRGKKMVFFPKYRSSCIQLKIRVFTVPWWDKIAGSQHSHHKEWFLVFLFTYKPRLEQDFSTLALLTFRAREFIVGRGCPAIVGLFTALLASTYSMLIASPVLTTKNVSRHC